tara:strand:+ start:136 stop:273 length:138 start_codon:yes stop_codon:yes gene_type:complete
MGINYSQQTTNSVVDQYEFRIDALLKKIEFLEAQIEVSKEFFKYR